MLFDVLIVVPLAFKTKFEASEAVAAIDNDCPEFNIVTP